MNDKAEEKRIYTATICSTCGGKKSKQDIVIQLHPKQMAFLRSIPQAYAVKDEHVSSVRLDALPPPILEQHHPHPADRILFLLALITRTGRR